MEPRPFLITGDRVSTVSVARVDGSEKSGTLIEEAMGPSPLPTWPWHIAHCRDQVEVTTGVIPAALRSGIPAAEAGAALP